MNVIFFVLMMGMRFGLASFFAYRSAGSDGNDGKLDGACLRSAVLGMKKFKDVVGNFERNQARLDKQDCRNASFAQRVKRAPCAANREGKKGRFGPVINRIAEAGGGNASAPVCGGSPDTDAAKKMAEITAILMDCESTINASCHPSNLPDIDEKLEARCVADVQMFKTHTTKCIDVSTAEHIDVSTTEHLSKACSCWTDESYVNLFANIKDCGALYKSGADNHTQSVKACKQAFSRCRKFEDSVGSAILACGSQK